MAKKAKKATKSADKTAFKKVTAVLIVEAIEPCLDLWVNRLGFKKAIEVPEGSRLGFVGLTKGKFEVMYQTMESVAKDVPAFATRAPGGTNLFIEVESIDAIEKAVSGMPIAVPRRKTFYGSTEIGVKDPAGNVVLFAEMGG